MDACKHEQRLILADNEPSKRFLSRGRIGRLLILAECRCRNKTTVLDSEPPLPVGNERLADVRNAPVRLAVEMHL